MSFDGRELRNALGRFATGVCVITTRTDDGRSLGMTANSFSSVSLDPPLVLWNLQSNSEVFAEFAYPERFAINVLALEQQNLSNQYARKGDHLLDPQHFRLGRNGTPVIREALVTYECALWANYDGGDHAIVVGEVLDLVQRPDGKPLLFFSGGYREIH